MSPLSGWIAVDLDRTLAHYDKWQSIEHIGEPVPAMLERVKEWLAEGIEVRIFTARMSCEDEPRADFEAALAVWCVKHGLPVLKATNAKDFHMIALYDDLAVSVEPNTGRTLSFR